jgi:hypothetical protein
METTPCGPYGRNVFSDSNSLGIETDVSAALLFDGRSALRS